MPLVLPEGAFTHHAGHAHERSGVRGAGRTFNEPAGLLKGFIVIYYTRVLQGLDTALPLPAHPAILIELSKCFVSQISFLFQGISPYIIYTYKKIKDGCLRYLETNVQTKPLNLESLNFASRLFI